MGLAVGVGVEVGVSGSDFLSLVKTTAKAMMMARRTKPTTTAMIIILFLLDLKWEGMRVSYCMRMKFKTGPNSHSDGYRQPT